MAADPEFLLMLYAETGRFLQQQAWSDDWRVVVICPHRGLQFGALTPVQEFVERRSVRAATAATQRPRHSPARLA